MSYYNVKLQLNHSVNGWGKDITPGGITYINILCALGKMNKNGTYYPDINDIITSF